MASHGALQVLDTIVAGAVQGAPASVPPATPQFGQCFLVGDAPTGAWVGHARQIAAFTVGGWRFVSPVEGMQVHLPGNGGTAVFRGEAWDIGTVVAKRVLIDGEQVLGSRRAAIAAPVGGTTTDAQVRAAIGDILGTLRHHGLIAE
jgi:hypothetical protein